MARWGVISFGPLSLDKQRKGTQVQGGMPCEYLANNFRIDNKPLRGYLKKKG